MGLGRRAEAAADTGMDAELTEVREAARAAKLARLTVFAPALSMDPELWGVAIQQVEQQGWRMQEWAVVAMPGGPVAWPVFRS